MILWEAERTRYGWIARAYRDRVLLAKGYASSRAMAVARARKKAMAVAVRS